MSNSQTPGTAPFIGTIDDILSEIKALRAEMNERFNALDRKVDDFKSSYEHHSAQESRVHRDIREDIRDVSSEVGRFNGGINALSRDLGRVDERVGILESAI